MTRLSRLAAAGLGIALAVAVLALPTAAAETPRRGGTLTFMIPADAPPSLDGHRETTFATIQSAAPFYSVLIRVDPDNPSNSTDFVCDLCIAVPAPTDDGKTYVFKIREGVKFHDGTPLTAYDVAASWQKIIRPPEGVTSSRESHYLMVDSVAAPDPTTVVFRLKFATSAFLPALAEPYAFIYQKAILDKDPRRYEMNVMGSGPFKFAGYETGQSIKGVCNIDYYRRGQPYLDGFIGIFAPKQAVRVDAILADRAAGEFRGLPPSARDQLQRALGDKIVLQESDWNCRHVNSPNHQKKPFDDVRVRRALALAIDQWHGAPALSKIAKVKTVGGIVFPGSPLAATKAELETIAGYWPDIEKSRAEARRLLKEAGAEGLAIELFNRNIDQPYKFVGTWLADEGIKVGLKVSHRDVPIGPAHDGLRKGTSEVALEASCNSVVNPLMDVQKYLPGSVFAENYGHFEDQPEIDLYERMVREVDPAKQRALMREFERYVLDTKAHGLAITYWNRIVPLRSYVKGWKVSPSHYVNQGFGQRVARQVRPPAA